MSKKEKETDAGALLGGTLNILGMKIDLGELLSSSEDIQGRLEELREELKTAGGKESLSDDEWRRGGISVSGHIRTRGPLGEREFHVGTTGRIRKEASAPSASEAPEVTEPPADVFDEGQRITIVADVPGVGLEDLELKVEGKVLFLSTRSTTRRSYRKELRLGADVDPESLEATCRNGVLEVHLHKRGTATGRRSQS